MGTFKPATKVVRCPACGAVNPAGKSKHCDSCGCYLPGLLEVEERLPDPVPVYPVYDGSKLIAFQDAGSDYIRTKVVAPRSSFEDSIFLSALQAQQTQAPDDNRAGGPGSCGRPTNTDALLWSDVALAEAMYRVAMADWDDHLRAGEPRF